MMPLISILIPAYNAEEWIADTISSALAQTWPLKEIIVVDDGSTDATFDVARRFESSGVRVIQQQNQGASAARNLAYSACKGDYIQWLDADDLLAPDKIASQLELLDRGVSPEMVFNCSWGHFLYRTRKARFTPTPLWCDLTPSEFLLRKLQHKAHMQTSTWLVSRALTDAAGPWNTGLSFDDDGEYFCRVLSNCKGVRFVPNARVYYRQVGASSLSYVGQSDRKLESQWRSMKLHIHYLRSMDDSDRARSACVCYLQNYLISFFAIRPDIVKEMSDLAAELGGQLQPPHLPWKYRWIESAAGWKRARRAQLFLPRVKWSVAVWFEKAYSRFDRRKDYLSLAHSEPI